MSNPAVEEPEVFDLAVACGSEASGGWPDDGGVARAGRRSQGTGASLVGGAWVGDLWSELVGDLGGRRRGVLGEDLHHTFFFFIWTGARVFFLIGWNWHETYFLPKLMIIVLTVPNTSKG
jgi:hypothetical protein